MNNGLTSRFASLTLHREEISPKRDLSLLFDSRNKLTDEGRIFIENIENYLKNHELCRSNYKKFFQYNLWLIEIEARISLSHYDMKKVTVNPPTGKMVKLSVEGLAEKRPSLIRGDKVKMGVHSSSKFFTGKIEEVLEKDIKIAAFPFELIKKIRYKSLKYDVQFQLNSLAYERMHKAVDLCSNNLNLLFPQTKASNKEIVYNLVDAQIQNNAIKSNKEQRQAVMNILNNSSRGAPYIVFGPPGTGKSVTIVEAIYQIAKRKGFSKILVCAPSNAACDMLVSKLAKYFSTKQLVRVRSKSADWSTVSEDCMKYNTGFEDILLADKSCDQLQTSRNVMKKVISSKIVVTTLMSAGRLSKYLSATHVFIDEAAQALEPEALIAVSCLLTSNGLLVLAGDPKQLGPICNSKIAENSGFDISLLGRLMKMDLYTNESSQYFITQLKLNYRNHPDILHLPNKLFYNSSLKVAIEHNDPISKQMLIINGHIFPPKAVEFYGVDGQESRGEKSPSYFNEDECKVVLKYIKVLTNPDCEDAIPPEDIGVVVPYIKQAYFIREKLQNRLEKVEVGTTESFQGREKRVIIISTVRGKRSLLVEDKKFNIGFVSNPERFNVAVTRAISKLIIVGNPHCLVVNENWRKMIEFCQQLGSYGGCSFPKERS